MSPLRVLWLRPSVGDNISVRRERIATELRQRGYEIDIRDASGTDMFGAIKQAVSGKYDIIAGNVRIGLYLGYPLARILGKPFLGDVSDPISDIDDFPEPLFRGFEWYEWQALERADAAVFVYESSYREALERGVDHAYQLPNAVEYETFADPEQAAVERTTSILQKEGVDLSKRIAIYIGVFEHSYKIGEILATAEKASDWEFVFLGEGELTEDVRESAKTTENVYYPGAFDYSLMPGFLSHADVGFCFKDAEQPLKLKEYGAAGLPIIARPGELSEFYDEDELVFVQPDPPEIAATLARLDEDGDLREAYAAAGRDLATEWSWKEIAAQYDEIFQEIQ